MFHSVFERNWTSLRPKIWIIISIYNHACLPCKKALVKPLLERKKTLDPDELKNNRPVSNLSYVSKLMEKAV